MRRPPRQRSGGQGMPGLGIDAYGGQVIDPTENVLALVAAGSQRQDDLRTASERLQDEKIRASKEVAKIQAVHLKELNELRAGHQQQITSLESRRLDAINQVNVQAVQTSAERANTAIETLAKVTAANSAANAAQLAQLVTTITERLAALEKSSYEGAGKQAVADPMMAELITQVKNLSTSQQTRRGSDEGKGSYTTTLIAIFAVLLSLVSTVVVVFRH